MKKPIFITMFLCLVISTSFGRVKYTLNGNFLIGDISNPRGQFELKSSGPTLFYEATNGYGTIMQRFVESSTTYKGAYTKYSNYTDDFYIGIHYPSSSSTSDDRDILKILGNDGAMYHYPQNTANYAAGFSAMAPQNYSYCWVVNRGGAWNFMVEGRGKVWYQTLSQLSDESVKEDITDIVNSKTLLAQLRPVKFKYKAEAFGSDEPYSDYNYGLIAQEVEQVIPDIVSERYDGKKGVSYTDLIPLLIDAVNEQQNEIDDLKTQIANLNTSELKSLTNLDNKSLKSIDSKLFQNVPNPFKESTNIKYSLTEIESYSMVNIYDLQGKQIKSYQINQPGKGEIEIPGSSLSPGIYIYNLIVDGNVIDSKQMVLTN